jgi:hypothetical protein
MAKPFYNEEMAMVWAAADELQKSLGFAGL